MAESLKLFMVLLGCKPKGRHTEQHDIFFGIARTAKDLIPDIIAFWPEAKGKVHADAWRAVTNIDNYRVTVKENGFEETNEKEDKNKIFFINLGGYKENEFEEFHYKMLVVTQNKGAQLNKLSKQLFINTVALKEQKAM